MKQMLALTLLLASLLSTSAFAQNRRGGDGSITLRDGRTILRIDVGDDRDDRELLRRVHRLEKAVRDLQDKVYELQNTVPAQTLYTCYGNIFSIGTVKGQGYSRIEAMSNAMAECNRKGGSIFCKEKEIKCD